MNKLKEIIENSYPIQIDSIHLLRKRIGQVYKIQTRKKTYLLKVYLDHQADLRNRTIQAMKHCIKHRILVPKIHQTKNQSDFFFQGNISGVLMDFIYGGPPSKNELIPLATLAKNLHQTFNKNPLEKKEHLGQDYYIKRFDDLLCKQNYNQDKSHKWIKYLHTYYQAIEAYPRTFCHGDFHNENMIKDPNGDLYLIDFDAANYTSSLIDIATITDLMDFNHFKQKDFEQTLKQIKKFVKLYDPDRELNIQFKDVLSFIPIRHAELIATITFQTKEELSIEFLDLQYQWMEDFHQALKQATLG